MAELPLVKSDEGLIKGAVYPREAMYYEKLSGGRVQCLLCYHRCKIPEGEISFCKTRVNREGIMFTTAFSNPCAVHVAPIEREPMYHFLPGTTSLSIATVGCNFSCLHCQNHEISQFARKSGQELPGRPISPVEIVDKSLKTGCRSISYTYTEPTMFFELVFDTAELASKQGIKNSFITNGYMTEEALYQLSPYLDAANIDLKSFRDDFYKRVCGARLKPVLDTIKRMHELGIWIEITTLIIPEENDSPEELEQIAEFIFQLSPGIPWHVSAFYPHFQMEEKSPTQPETIAIAREIGKKVGLEYIYSGNVPCDPGAHTYCPQCNLIIIERQGFRVTNFNLSNGCCPSCGRSIVGIF